MQILKKRSKAFSIDWKLFASALVISAIGIATLVSTELSESGGIQDFSVIKKQIIFVVAGIVFYLILSVIDLSYLKYWQIVLPIYLVSIALLVLVLLFGPVVNNVQRWLIVGGVQIQPSEIAKVSVIINTALIFSLKKKYNEWILFLISFILAIPAVILVYMEPGGSMSLLILALWFIVAFTGLGNQFRNLVLLVITGSIATGLAMLVISGNYTWLVAIGIGLFVAILSFYARDTWRIFVVSAAVIGLLGGFTLDFVWSSVLHDYQKDRIEAFVNPEETENDIGFNVAQSRIAIGSGKIWGKGYGNGTQSKRNFLPEHQTDFIFASFTEEFGLVGSILLLAIYGFLIIEILLVSMKYSDNIFFSMLAVGIAFKILLEVFINIGTNTGIIPATGIPLPLMSAGGSITVMTFISLGLIQSIKNSSKENIKSVSFIDF